MVPFRRGGGGDRRRQAGLTALREIGGLLERPGKRLAKRDYHTTHLQSPLKTKAAQYRGESLPVLVSSGWSSRLTPGRETAPALPSPCSMANWARRNDSRAATLRLKRFVQDSSMSMRVSSSGTLHRLATTVRAPPIGRTVADPIAPRRPALAPDPFPGPKASQVVRCPDSACRSTRP